MIEYALQDEAGNLFQLNDTSVEEPARGSLTYLGDSFRYENKIINNSFLSGASKVGESRLTSRAFVITYTRALDDSAEYRTKTNTLIEFFTRTEYIIDVANNRRMKVTPESFEIVPSSGTLQHVSEDSFTFLCLNPYWEDVTLTQVGPITLSRGIENQYLLDNIGFLPINPTISYSFTPAQTSILSLRAESLTYQEIIEVEGITGPDIIIDCENGTVQEGDFVTTTISSEGKIVPGTGFFRMPPGESVLALTWYDGAIDGQEEDVFVSWRNRYYV